MTASRLKVLTTLSTLVVLSTPGLVRAQADELPSYVGEAVCQECHSPGHGRRPCLLGTIAEHNRAYQTLGKLEAGHIASVSGVTEKPRESRICLGCHATGSDAGPRWMTSTFNIADGVQCETCHGAGSLHVAAYSSSEDNRSLDRQQGIGRGNRAECVACHVDRPSHQLVLEQGYRLPPADRLYKTPVNLTVSPDGGLLYVVCEHGNSLVVVDLETGSLLDEIPVGKRPHDVAISPDGRRLYVTNRQSDSLTVIDATSRSVVTEVPVGDEPHGVLTDVTGKRLFVLNTQEDSISVLDTKTLTEVTRLPAGCGPWSLALRPDGNFIYVTNVRPRPGRFREPPRSEITVINADQGIITTRFIAVDANMLEGIAFIPGTDVALITLLRTKNLVPITRLAQGWTITNGLGVVWPDGSVDQVLLDAPADYFPDPMDMAVSPDGQYALVTSGGSDQVAVVDVGKLLSMITTASDRDREAVLPNHLGTSTQFVIKRVAVGRNPRGVVFSRDGRFAYVANALDDSVTVIETTGYTVVNQIDLGGPCEITEIRRGERLFHSAGSAFGSQFSCRSCHPDGHINGLTHDIEADGVGLSPVDNRTLRGIVDTGPFKWEGTNPSLRRQCGPRLAVFFTRLHPLSPSELTALVRYISTIERPPNRYRPAEGLTLAQFRGKAVFERTVANDGTLLRPEQRCVHCHHGPYQTSRGKTPIRNKMWFDELVDLEFFDLFDRRSFGELGMYYYLQTGRPPNVLDVPHLTNVYDSPPYLHNGSANTLEEIWTLFNIVDDHGMTKDLTRQQFNDLIAYLKSL